MGLAELSANAQNYLKAVWGLAEWSDEPVTASDIAAKTGMKTSTVSGAVAKLADQGLLEHARYGAVSLTPEGERYAVAMVRRHRLIETFLVQVLDYRWDQVHDEADRLEHVVSDLMVERMAERLGHPTRDPHGDPIPDASGAVVRPDAAQLLTVAPGSRVRVERISDDDPSMLQHFADHGLDIGVTATVEEPAPYADALSLRIDGRDAPLPLGQAASAAVWVSLID
ncbi:MAG: metal-dependent transcriptional regulator [Aeromicrobium sp.]|uniref:metal-dependent transcriptional regulator n=1 Tax=Aeromicrobium sp. TaxID=1871063 RepID=UPI0039E240D9